MFIPVPYTSPQTSIVSDAQVLSTGSIPLRPLLLVAAESAGIRIYILPGTPNITQAGNIVSSGTHSGSMLNHLIEINGLVSIRRNGVMIIGTAASIDAQYGTSFAVTRIIPVIGISPQMVVDDATSFIPSGTLVFAEPDLHAIVVRGSQQSVDRVATILNSFAVGASQSTSFAIKNGADPKTLVTMLSQIAPPLPPETLFADTPGSRIIASGPPAYIDEVKSALALIDRSTPTVLYNITIAEVDPKILNDDVGTTFGQQQSSIQQSGTSSLVQPSSPTPGQGIFSFPFHFPIDQAGTLGFQINAMVSHGTAKLLRKVQITAVNGQIGSTSYNTTVVVPLTNQINGTQSVQTIPVGLTISIAPSIGQNTLSSKFNIVYSDITGTGAMGYPEIGTRSLDTVAVTKFGDSFLVGGLYSSDSSHSVAGLPILSRIPIIGPILFGRTQKQGHQSEIVMIIHPVVYNNGVPSGAIRKSYPDMGPALHDCTSIGGC